jgi:hypothetical protein
VGVRRIDIESTELFLTESFGAEIRVSDSDTGELLDNVQAITVLISVDDAISAHLVCIKMKDKRHCEVDDNSELIEYEEDVLVRSIHIG